jgi:hypothetical protein
MDINVQILTWIMTTVGFAGFIFAGKKEWWAWYINMACQILWFVYALATGQPAFLVFAVAYFVIFARNAYLWTKDHLDAKKIWALKPGETAKFGRNTTVTMLSNLPEEESNLVQHARRELKLLGEEDNVIDWYVRVIKEYASFGHSGGSHMAVMPSLTRLLNFQPLTQLTNEPSEWFYHGSDIWGEPGGIWQSKRDGRMFSKDAGLSFTCVDDPKDENGERPVYLSKVTHADISQS